MQSKVRPLKKYIAESEEELSTVTADNLKLSEKVQVRGLVGCHGAQLFLVSARHIVLHHLFVVSGPVRYLLASSSVQIHKKINA